MEPDDPFGWLEDVTGGRALEWVRARNAETVAELAGTEEFRRTRDDILAVLDSDDRIPYPARRGAHWYNFWRDAAHPRGLWRRTTPESYATGGPDWEILLDLDELAEAEGENWVWQGAQVLPPEYGRALLSLSRGGADAAVVREYDLTTREFVPDGFTLPESRSYLSWIDADRVFVATDFGPGTLTEAGYPRTARLWHRGTPLAEAEPVYEGEPGDTLIAAYQDHAEGFRRAFVRRGTDFHRAQVFRRADDGTLSLIEVPDDARIGVHHEWLTVELRSPWTVAGTEHPAGALLATPFDAFMAGERNLTVLFTPDPHTALGGYSWTRHHLILELRHDVASRLEVRSPGPDGWTRHELPGSEPLSTASAWGTDEDADDEYLLDVQGFLTPATLLRGETPAGGTVTTLRRAPSFFDTAGLSVAQRFAVSPDGTRVPYFVVGPEGSTPDAPTLLYGYGGFDVSWTPRYSGALGRSWLARGGRYVLANLRGGGEYGPAWHTAALRENRVRVYQDFEAVARDLLDTGVTTPARLGIQGGSNGGYLVSVMLTRCPELFGAAVAQVPLTDMRHYHRMLAGALWTAEYGDPDDPDDWAFLAPFSPYHAIAPEHRTPPVLYTTSTRDDRVHPGHARKMVARMREQGHRVAYYENVEGGHGTAADNKQLAFMTALVYEFLWKSLTPP